MLKIHFFLVFVTCLISVYAYIYDQRNFETDKLLLNLIRNNGDEQSRIVHGHIPPRHTLPFMAHIFIRDLDRGNHVRCTGTIIASRFVLTTYNCTAFAAARFGITLRQAEGRIVVKVGSNFHPQGQMFSVIATRVTDYAANAIRTRGTFGEDDIAILKLNRAIFFDNRNTAPIALGVYELEKGQRFPIAGFGNHVMGGASVQENSYVIGHATVYRNNGLNDKFFYTKDYDEGPADGDNGGPALKEVKPNQYVQFGMNLRSSHSFVPGTDALKVDGTYLKIGPYCSFIQTATEGKAKCTRQTHIIG